VILLVINCSSTCFGRLYAHHQEVRLRFTAYGFLSCCSCCDVGESDGKLCTLFGVGCLSCCSWCYVGESDGKLCALCGVGCLTYSTQFAIRLSYITTATTGQKTIGSETQSDLLMMGVKTANTC
jgi:hypothetical protein